MPNALRIGAYRFFFWSHEKRDEREAKFWLEPLVELSDNWGFASHELNHVGKLVEKYREGLLERWYDHLGENRNHSGAG